jgi:hypothetical protein
LDGDDYEIPDTDTGKWIKTNPQRGEGNQGAPSLLERVERPRADVKYWNNNARHGEEPMKLSFLIEVMALECLHGGWQGRFDYELWLGRIERKSIRCRN